MARVAEQAFERDHMFEFIVELTNYKLSEYTIEERNLISVGFKNYIAEERRAISLVDDISRAPRFIKYKEGCDKYIHRLELQL